MVQPATQCELQQHLALSWLKPARVTTSHPSQMLTMMVEGDAEVHGSSNSSVPLLALPDELLAMCLPGEGSDACSASRTYMRTCWRLMHLYLRGFGHDSLRLCLSLTEQRTKSTALPLLAQACPVLHKLEVVIGEGSTEEHLRLLLMPAPPMSSTPHLTHLRVVGGCMVELIPAFLANACPHLKDLEYRDVVFQSPQQCQPASLAKLQRLQLNQCQQLPLPEQFRGQLRALPSLTDFSYSPGAHGVQSDDASSVCTAVAESLSSSATHLCVYASSTSGASAEPTKQLFANNFLALTSLHLPGITVNDAILTDLLQRTPQVTTLQVVAFELEEDHSSKSCAWKQVCMNHVSVASLARLPLSSVTQLNILPGEGSPTLQLVHTGISADMDMDLTAKAVAAVQRCGGLTCQHGGEQNTTVIIPVLSCAEQVFSASIPLLTHLHAIRFHHARVTLPFQQALHGLPALRMLGFGVGCYIEDAVWEKLSASLMQVEQLHFSGCVDNPWALVIIMWHATHPITLSLCDEDWAAKDKDLLRRNVMQLERMLVTLQYDSTIKNK